MGVAVGSSQVGVPQHNLVLLVEDDPTVRGVVAATLRHHGYGVVTAEDGVSGLEAFTQNRGSIRVVLTDTLMPRMGGIEMVQAIRELDPRIPIISTSGMPDPDVIAEFGALNVTAFIPKPYRQAELLRAVAVAMQGDPQTGQSAWND
jgi:CheY-like chemotaxis protein